MKYMYAVVDDTGKCYQVHRSTNYMCDKYHIPIDTVAMKYLSKYYYPIPKAVASSADFEGKWYYDINRTIEVK